MTIRAALAAATKKLRRHSDSPRLDAEVLLSYILNQDRASLLIHGDRVLEQAVTRKLTTLILQRANKVPVPYLTGRCCFFGLELRVTPAALIPRPCTELLVEAILQRLPINSRLTIADIGTGSGAIALALAKHLPQATIIATDISSAALATAKKNAHQLRLADHISFLQCSLLKSYNLQPNALQPDFIIANLPYLRPEQLAEPSISHEPRLALAGGRDGLDHIRRLLRQAATFPTISLIALEIDPGQVRTTRDLLRRWSSTATVTTVSDGLAIRGLLACSGRINTCVPSPARR